MSQPDLRGLRVVVVGINYAPEHSGIAPYTTEACEHLQVLGAEVFVLAGIPHYPNWSFPDGYRGRLRTTESINGVRVRRLRHHVPPRQSALRRIAYEVTFGSHAFAQALPFRPDVVLAVVPSLFGTVAGALLARRHSADLIVWVQDLMGPATAQSGIAGGGAISGVTSALEAWALRRAEAVAVLSDSFRSYVEGAGVPSERVHVVPNWTHVRRPTADRAATRKQLGWGAEEKVVLHSGNMGLKQGLENVIAAARLAAARSETIRFVLMGDGSQRAALQSLAVDVPTLDFMDPVSDERFPDVLAAADVLLVNERSTTLDMSLPSKLTSYFRAGRPVIAAVPHLGGTAAEITKSGGGVIVEPESASALLLGIKELVGDDALLDKLAEMAATYSEEHLDRRASLKALAALLSSSLPRTSFQRS